VVERIQEDVAEFIGAFSIGNVGVFVEDVEEIHQVTAEADDFWWKRGA